MLSKRASGSKDRAKRPRKKVAVLGRALLTSTAPSGTSFGRSTGEGSGSPDHRHNRKSGRAPVTVEEVFLTLGESPVGQGQPGVRLRRRGPGQSSSVSCTRDKGLARRLLKGAPGSSVLCRTRFQTWTVMGPDGSCAGWPGGQVPTNGSAPIPSRTPSSPLLWHPRFPGRGCASSRRPGSGLTRWPAHHGTLRPSPGVPRPPRHLHRRHLHRWGQPVARLAVLGAGQPVPAPSRAVSRRAQDRRFRAGYP